MPVFLEALFGPTDRVVVAQLLQDGTWQNHPLALQEAIKWALANQETPNIYFRASSHDGSRGYGEQNCCHAGAFLIDIDYGKVGHRGRTPFGTLDDVMGYLLTLPVRPSICWHTGHGVQAAFLLDQPACFYPGGGTAETLLRYRTIGSCLSSMVMGDSTFTAEHAFRIPGTINRKSHLDPTIPDVTGQPLWFHPNKRYTLDEIEQACGQRQLLFPLTTTTLTHCHECV